MASCPECQTTISERARTCPYCGFCAEDPNHPIACTPSVSVPLQWDEDTQEAFDNVIPISRGQEQEIISAFSNASELARIAPAAYNFIQSLHPEKMMVADLSPTLKEMLEKGLLKFQITENGEILGHIIKEGDKGIHQVVRLKEVSVAQNLSESLSHLQMQLQLAEIAQSIKALQHEVEHLRRGARNDRLSLVEGAWQELEQALRLTDARRREEKLIALQSQATLGKVQLIHEFSEHVTFFAKRKGKGMLHKLLDSEGSEKGSLYSKEIFETLAALLSAFRIEYNVYLVLGEQEAAKTVLRQFYAFLQQENLMDRNTFLRWSSHADLKTAKQIETNFIPQITSLEEKIRNMIALPPSIPLLPPVAAPIGMHPAHTALVEYTKE